ncbi:MAG: DsbC family protein [Sulfurimonadaceae bacterium]|jgi:thiol:disulfide interchange protein DsbC
MRKKVIVLSILGALSLNANSSNVELEYIQSVLPNTKIAKYNKSFIDGFYDVYLENGNILHVNPFKEVFFAGEIVAKNGFSITGNYRSKWQEELSQNQIKDLESKKLLEHSKSFTYGKGSGDIAFVLFTDPECPYCIKLEEYLQTQDATVHINYMPLPFHKNAKELSLKALSAKDFKQAHSEAKKGNVTSVDKITDEAKTKLEAMMKLAEELGVKGTPKTFVVNTAENKVIGVINGADVPKFEKYLNKEAKNENAK